MFERLILCEYAVADLTTANANVFYELGVRHAVRRRQQGCEPASNDLEAVGRILTVVRNSRGVPDSAESTGNCSQPEKADRGAQRVQAVQPGVEEKCELPGPR